MPASREGSADARIHVRSRRRSLPRRILRWSLYGAGAGALVLFLLLSSLRVETTRHGAPTRLRLPVPKLGAVAFPVHAAKAADFSVPGFLDGPVARRDGDGWTAKWFCENRAFDARGNGDTLAIECAGKAHAWRLDPVPPPAAVAPMPARVVVLSDIEGNATFLERALRKLGVVDAAGGWALGDGHLVILGDSVDRGRDVFAVLWRLHDLALQARDAGGAVRMMLGNHEQYLLCTNPTRANPDHLAALNAMGGYQGAFAQGTVLGDWLRVQPVLLRLGPVLFAHGGISPGVAASGLSIVDINTAMRDYWDTPRAHPRSPALDAAIGLAGVTQYRGYFRASEGRYPAAGEADITRVLARFGASAIVVGHTQVERIERLHGGRVFAVDVNSNEAAAQALVFEDGIPRIVDIGVGRGIEHDGERLFREFSLFSAADRALLSASVRDMRRLSSLPYPY
jgi:hypothetical protein